MCAQATKPLRVQDSFFDALHSEIIAGSENLTDWIRQVQDQGAIDSLFGLETWLRGLRSFFNLEHLPLSETEKSSLTMRSFAPEIGIVRQAVQMCEGFAADILNPGVNRKFEFDDFIETQMQRDRVLDYSLARLAEQLTPADSISRLAEFLNDLRVTLDSLKLQPGRDFQIFLSIGRSFSREVKYCRYVDMLMSQTFKLQFDSVDSKLLSAALRRVPHESVRRKIATVVLYLFRSLKYLRLVRADLERDRSLKRNLVLFALMHEEMGNLSDFIRARLLKTPEIGSAVQNAAELIAYSVKMESQRVQNGELVLASRETDPRIVYSRIEDSHGILRSCCQSCILTLIHSFDKNFDAAELFPVSAGQLVAAEKLRKDLWELRRWLMELLASQEEVDSNRIIERINAFKDDSMGSLMYRDWAEFEAFSDAVAVSVNFGEIRTHVRRFVIDLETLIQEVSKRSVFKEDQETPILES
jgi:hypothetical protein